MESGSDFRLVQALALEIYRYLAGANFGDITISSHKESPPSPTTAIHKKSDEKTTEPTQEEPPLSTQQQTPNQTTTADADRSLTSQKISSQSDNQ